MTRLLRKIVGTAAPLALFLAALLLYIAATGEAREAMAQCGRGLTVVIDAGHGGVDGGAVSRTGAPEDEINLRIAEKIEQLAALYGYKPVMTRSGGIDYPAEADSIRKKKTWDQKARVALINGTERAVLISVHQNNFTSGRASGAQVFYAATGGSRELAETVQESLVGFLDPANGRAAAPASKDIYLMRSVECPAVLVECGFLSNEREERLLQTDEYRTRIACAVAAGFFVSAEELAGTYGGTDEG